MTTADATARSRVLAGLPDLANARDLGGLRTHDGRRTRHGRLWRSSTPSFLDAEQAPRLGRDLGLRLRIDLRSRGEVGGTFNPHLAQADRAVLHAPISAGPPQGQIPEDHVEALVQHYLRYLENARESVRTIAEALAQPEGMPALLHCTLGKDRTGVVVAVVLSAVGVVGEELVRDYVRTTGANGALLARLRALPEYRQRLERLPAEALDAVPAVMRKFLAEVATRHGGEEEYLLSAGVTPGTIAALTNQLVESD